MRKQNIRKGILAILLLYFLFPLTVFGEEVTFGQLQDEYTRAQKELNDNNQSIENQEHQIDTNNSTIQSLKQQIEDMGTEAEKLQQEIADADTEINGKKEQTKELIAYYQMSQGENIYLEYIFGGDTITDLIYRLSVVEQITEYNEKAVKDLEALIKANESRKQELAAKEKEYDKKIEKLNTEITKLNSSVNKLSDLSPSLEQEVESKRQLVNYYKSQGCSARSHVIGRDCAVTTTNATFARPIRTGYITSFVGYRGGALHRGLDIGSSQGKNTALYSIGNGVIQDIWHDKFGANNVTVQYQTTNGKYYTAIYAHLSRYGSIYKGMEVNTNTILGYMGNTGYSFGVHLHLEVWPCRLYEDSNCKTWSRYVNFTNQKFKEGFKGATSVINFPNKTYQTWYNR